MYYHKSDVFYEGGITILISAENIYVLYFYLFSMKHDLEQEQIVLIYLKHLKPLGSESRYFKI